MTRNEKRKREQWYIFFLSITKPTTGDNDNAKIQYKN